MSTGTLTLLYLCAIAGFFVVIFSLLLIAKGRIYIDSQTKEVSDIELPLGFKFKTNAPVILLFLLGGGLLTYPVWQVTRATGKPFDSQRRAYLNGKIESLEPVRAVAVADEKYDVIGDFNLQVPLAECQYTVIYTARNGVTRLGQEIVELKADQSQYTLKGPNAKLVSVPSDPLAELKAPIREEPKANLAEFKPAEGGDQ
jgi:hypothetical protein